MEAVRYQGSWFKILPKPFEPERQRYKIVWSMLREPDIRPESAYKTYFQSLREEVKVLYPDFRKENDN